MSVLVFESVLGWRGAGSGERGAGSTKWIRETLTASRDPPAAWRQPDTNTSTDTGSRAAPFSARVRVGWGRWRRPISG